MGGRGTHSACVRGGIWVCVCVCVPVAFQPGVLRQQFADARFCLCMRVRVLCESASCAVRVGACVWGGWGGERSFVYVCICVCVSVCLGARMCARTHIPVCVCMGNFAVIHCKKLSHAQQNMRTWTFTRVVSRRKIKVTNSSLHCQGCDVGRRGRQRGEHVNCQCRSLPSEYSHDDEHFQRGSDAVRPIPP